MATPRKYANRNLVEMAWDPVTRIVGNLGIYTKIDFDNREVVECHIDLLDVSRLQRLPAGKDPRDAHFITSRICGICGDNHATCSVYAQNMAYGIKMPPMAEWIYNLGEAAEYMFDHAIFQDNLVVRRLLRADGREKLIHSFSKGESNAGAARDSTWAVDDRRHHACVRPVHRRVLSRGATT